MQCQCCYEQDFDNFTVYSGPAAYQANAHVKRGVPPPVVTWDSSTGPVEDWPHPFICFQHFPATICSQRGHIEPFLASLLLRQRDTTM